MLRTVLTSTLGTLVLVGGLTACNYQSVVNRVLPGNETSSDATATKARITPTSLEKSVHQQINQYRQSRNLPPLTLDPRISEQARLHSQAMASGKVAFSHNGFEQRIKAISRLIFYRQVAENVAYN